MATEKVKRKLTAILSADVKGYSRLMGVDEVGTIRTLETYRRVMSDLIQKKGGRVVDSPGDNVLAEFASVVDALDSAVEIQRELKTRNVDLSESRRMEFRMGINLGDVVEEGERIYGDGVNIAARIEALSEAGGICISGTAFDHIGKRLPVGYEYLGEQAVKNIEKPVRVYRVLMEPEAAGKVIGEARPKRAARWYPAVAGLVAVLVIAGAVALWLFHFRPPPIELASKEKMAFPLPDIPSIAVLPFVNMSGDPKQEFLSDGITEEIITALSKVRHLFVISRQSTFSYKGKPVKVKQVSEELGVRYVLEGSVQRSVDRIRINAQLIDALTGHHLWANRYDLDLKDLFALQDEITIKILTAIQVKLTEGEQVSSYEKYFKGSKGFDCYLKFLEAVNYLHGHNIEDTRMGRRMAEEANEMCPENPVIYTLMGWLNYLEYWLGLGKSPQESITKGIELIQKALAIDNSLAVAHGQLSMFYTLKREHERAIAEAERAVALDPGGANRLMQYGMSLNSGGRSEEAIPVFQKAIRLDPLGETSNFLHLGHAYRATGRFAEAVSEYRKALQREPNNFFAHLGLTATYSMMGREQEARAEAGEVLRISPKFSVDSYAKRLTNKDQSVTDKFSDSLRKAGLPDKPPLPLPDKPSIAVLPFVNMSGDPEQEYFSDGITEDIITNLAKLPRLFVVSSNSSFLYKGKQVKIEEVARDLGVRHVLEGSVRRSGGRVRITAQLIDGKTGQHVWADKYDRELKEIFTVQDEVTRKVVSELALALTTTESERLFRKHTENFEAYELYLRARGEAFKVTKENNLKGMELSQRVIELAPKFAGGYNQLSLHLTFGVRFGFSISPREDLAKAFELAQKAVSVDDTFSPAYYTLANIYLMQGKHDDALAAANTAVRIIPGDDVAMLWVGYMLNWLGRGEEAIEAIKKAREVNPKYLYGRVPMFLDFMAMACFTAGRYEEASSNTKMSIERFGSGITRDPFLIASYSMLGRMEEAKELAQQWLKTQPTFTLSSWKMVGQYKRPEDSERLYNALRKAGLN